MRILTFYPFSIIADIWMRLMAKHAALKSDISFSQGDGHPRLWQRGKGFLFEAPSIENN